MLPTRILTNSEGAIYAVATGAPPAEPGANAELHVLLTGNVPVPPQRVAADLKAGTRKDLPALVARRRIRANHPALVFEAQGQASRQISAAVGVRAPGEPSLLRHPALAPRMAQWKTTRASALGTDWFGVALKGADPVRQLAKFFTRMQDGNGVLADNLFSGCAQAMNGVVLVDTELAPAWVGEHLAMQEAVYAEQVRLWHESAALELKQLAMTVLGEQKRKPGMLWPVRLRQQPNNPIAYGYYSFDERTFSSGTLLSEEALRSWLEAGAPVAGDKEPLMQSWPPQVQ